MNKTITTLFLLAFLAFPCHAGSTIDVERIVDAIGKAENSKVHPYGVIPKYKHTTPRQACRNTVNHALRDWNGKTDFISFLGSRYAPIGVKNDPKGLNKNWVKNVKYYYERGIK